MSEMVEHNLPSRAVARPLKILVPLIREDIASAREAVKSAGMPFYCSIGEKLIEAKGNDEEMSHGDFEPWIRRNFGFGRRQAAEYMNIARKQKGSEMGEVIPISVRGAIRKSRPENPNYGKKASWRTEVMDNVRRAREEAILIRLKEEMTRQQERDADRKLALRLIDIGFKILAKELHPDKGGTRDAMSRLGRVRERLKQSA